MARIRASFPVVESSDSQAATASEIQINPKEITMKFRALAIASVFVALLGTAAVKANATTDSDYLSGYHTMTYSNIYVYGGQTAGVGIRGEGNTNLRLTVYDNNNHLINSTVCRYSDCILTWTAAWNGYFHVTVENLSAYGTNYNFALEN